jgi:predicted DNA-binding protein
MITTTLTAPGYSQLNDAVAKHGHNASFYLRKAVEYALEPDSKMSWEDITRYSKDIAAAGRNISVRISEDQFELLNKLCGEYEIKMAQLLRHIIGKVIEDRYPNIFIMIGDFEYKIRNPYLSDVDYQTQIEYKYREKVGELQERRERPYRYIVAYSIVSWRQEEDSSFQSDDLLYQSEDAYEFFWRKFISSDEALIDLSDIHEDEKDLQDSFRAFVESRRDEWVL